jgi:hypothetical protein
MTDACAGGAKAIAANRALVPMTNRFIWAPIVMAARTGP